MHPHLNVTQYKAVLENTLVDPYEGRIAAAMTVGGSDPAARYEGFWVQCNQIYAHSTCIGPSLEAEIADYAQLNYNTIYGNLTEAMQTGRQNNHPTHDYLTGNVFNNGLSRPAIRFRAIRGIFRYRPTTPAMTTRLWPRARLVQALSL